MLPEQQLGPNNENTTWLSLLIWQNTVQLMTTNRGGKSAYATGQNKKPAKWGIDMKQRGHNSTFCLDGRKVSLAKRDNYRTINVNNDGWQLSHNLP